MKLPISKLISIFSFAFGLILIVSCGPIFSSTPQTTEFEGHYLSSFEVSSFVPCGSPEKPAYGKGYWLEAERASGFFDQYRTTISGVFSGTQGINLQGVEVYVHFAGELSPPATFFKGYGHLSQYSHEVKVTQVLTMALDQECPK